MGNEKYVLNRREINIYSRVLRRAILRNVTKHCRRISNEDLEDRIQDGLLRLVNRLSRGIEKPFWLLKYSRRIGVNLAIDYLRQYKRRKKEVDIGSVVIPVDPFDAIEFAEERKFRCEQSAIRKEREARQKHGKRQKKYEENLMKKLTPLFAPPT